MQSRNGRKTLSVIAFVISLFVAADFSAPVQGRKTISLLDSSTRFQTQTRTSTDQASSFRSEIPENYDPGFINKHSFHNRAFRKKGHRIAPNAQQGSRAVRIVYLVPADKPVRKKYQIAIGNAILHLQNFYQSQMGGGYSFSTHDPIVEVYITSHNSSYYSSSTSNSNDFFSKATSDGFAVSGGSFNDPNNRWIYYIDADPGCVNGNPQAVGGTSGVALLPANDLRGLTREQTLGLCGQNPDNNGPCRWIGGLGHELGHAFGLPHPPGCDQGSCSGGSVAFNSLMYVGYASYPQTYLLPDDINQLFGTGFFTVLALDGPRFNCSANPIDDSRVFVRAHYLDFLLREPDQPGWDYWTGNITHCGTDPACTGDWRVNTSKAFWYASEFLASHPGLRNPSGVTPDFNNAEFIRLCYVIYLQRNPNEPPDSDFSGYNFWLSELNGDTANDPGPNGYSHVIRAFLVCSEYRSRFGP